MAFTEPNNLYNTIKELIRKVMKDELGRREIDIFEVTDINSKNYTCNIKNIFFGKYAFTNVRIMGTGLGNLKGIMKLPNPGDIVVVTFIGDSETPVILGTIFDDIRGNTGIGSNDIKPLIKKNELLIKNSEIGSIIVIKENNDLIIRIADETGKIDNMPQARFLSDGNIELLSKNNSKIRLDNTGGFKLFNKDNFGVEVDSSGAMVLRANTILHSQTGGTF